MYIPKTVLDVTVKDQDGNTVFSRQKEYTVNYLWLEGGKEVPLKNWDITAQEHFEQGIQPGDTDSQTFVIPLTEETRSVDVEATFTFVYEKGKEAQFHRVKKTVVFTGQ